MSNLELWGKVEKTDPKHTKGAKIGQMNITAICPQFQRKNATEIFGSYGIGWGIQPESEMINYQTIGDTVLASYQATMFYVYGGNKGAFPISSSIKVSFITNGGKGYLKIDDEYMKKLQTDALTKGLSFLGFNSDVFEGKFDDNKYVQQMNNEFREQISPEPINQKKVNDAAVFFKARIDEDCPEETHQLIKDHFKMLSNDEKIATAELLKDKAPDSKKKYKSLLKDHLNFKPGEL